jgi:DNA invertase Pin-like site-specific DNA recombinase
VHAAGLGRRSAPISDRHLSKLAIVYIRQSSPQQIFDHQESRARQYALADYAATLGWPRDRIVVIDEDQGRSGRTLEQRPGFQRLLAEVTLDHVGLILALELNRLSRSSKDWYQLLELCGILGTLLADQDGVYDTNDTNDRLVLGLKGTMSEVELATMRNRLERGKLHKAQRGELILDVPCGYLKLPSGEVILDPDEQVRATVHLIFEKFAELGSFGKLYRHLRRNKVHIGIRIHRGSRRGELVWRPVARALLGRMLHHPIYAGAYAYGRRCVDPKRTAASGGKVRMRYLPMAEWKVLHRDRLPAYITWERYLANQQQLLDNRSWPEAPGVPRVGLALLPGLLVCGACGRRMHAGYRTKAKPYYECMRRKLEGSNCCGLGAAAVDGLVSQQVLRALGPRRVCSPNSDKKCVGPERAGELGFGAAVDPTDVRSPRAESLSACRIDARDSCRRGTWSNVCRKRVLSRVTRCDHAATCSNACHALRGFGRCPMDYSTAHGTWSWHVPLSDFAVAATLTRVTITQALSEPERVPVYAIDEEVDPAEISERSAASDCSWGLPLGRCQGVPFRAKSRTAVLIPRRSSSTLTSTCLTGRSAN